MAKVYAEQVKKAQFLATGLKSNYELVNSRLGITMEQIQALEAAADEAARMNAEVEALREEVSRKAALANRKLEDVKNILVLQNRQETRRKEMKLNSLLHNTLCRYLNFPIFENVVLKNI